MLCNMAMKVAIVVSHGRAASCFAGAEVYIVESPFPSGSELTASMLESMQILTTMDWHPLEWGSRLSAHGVGVLLCSGILPPTWAAVRGHGIRVIPNLMGTAEAVLASWFAGELQEPQFWPPNPVGFGAGPGFGRRRGRGRGRRRYRGGFQ